VVVGRDVVEQAHGRFIQCGLSLVVGPEDRELITADAGDNISAAHMFNNAIRHVLQQLIAYCITVCIIDWFELIDIDVYDRQPHARPVGVVEPFAGDIVEQALVGQPGQLIKPGQIMQFFIRSLKLDF